MNESVSRTEISISQKHAHLLLQLPVDGQVDSEGVFLASDAHGSVRNGSNRPSQVGDGLGGEFSLLGDRCGKLSCVILDVLQVSLDFGSQLLQVLNDGGIDGSGKVCVRVGDDSSLVSNSVEDVLYAKVSVSCRAQQRISD